MTTKIDSTGFEPTGQGLRSAPLERGVDFSQVDPGSGTVEAAGYGFVCRCLWHDRTDRIRAAADDYLRNGVGVFQQVLWQSKSPDCVTTPQSPDSRIQR